MRRDIKETVYFYCHRQGPPENAAYQHLVVCLAEGFSQLGVRYYSSEDYWRTSPDEDDFLLKRSREVMPADCSVVIVSSGIKRHDAPLPAGLFHPRRKYITVYLDEEDILSQELDADLAHFDFVFKAHYNYLCAYPSNFFPIAFGLSNRMLRELKAVPAPDERKRTIVESFRCKHDLRYIVRERFNPLISRALSIDDTIDDISQAPDDSYGRLMWNQTGRRHNPCYYERLRNSIACSAFGGKFDLSWPRAQWESHTDSDLSHLLSPILLQWDSWRFWESLAAGCVTFHVNLDEYGVQLPVMPVNWKHYVGIDLYDMGSAVERLIAEPSLLHDISSAGRAWAINNYSPIQVASRFLDTIYGPALSPSIYIANP